MYLKLLNDYKVGIYFVSPHDTTEEAEIAALVGRGMTEAEARTHLAFAISGGVYEKAEARQERKIATGKAGEPEGKGA